MKKILCLFTSHPFLAGLLIFFSVVFIGLPTQAQRLVIVSDYADPTFKLEDNGLPKEWSIKVWEGIPEIMVMQDKATKGFTITKPPFQHIALPRTRVSIGPDSVSELGMESQSIAGECRCANR